MTITIIITQWSHLFCQGGNHDNPLEHPGGSPSPRSPRSPPEPGGCRGENGRGAKEMPLSWAGWWEKEAETRLTHPHDLSPRDFPQQLPGGEEPTAFTFVIPFLFQRKEGKHPKAPQDQDASLLTGLLCSPRLDLSSSLAVAPIPISAPAPSPPQEHPSPSTTAPTHGGLEGPSPQEQCCHCWDTVPALSNLHLNPGKTTCRKGKLRQLEGHRLGLCPKAELDTEPGSHIPRVELLFLPLAPRTHPHCRIGMTTHVAPLMTHPLPQEQCVLEEMARNSTNAR